MTEHVPARIRRARTEDVEAVRRVLVATWHATYDAIYGCERVEEITSRWHAADVLRSQFEDPGRVCLVALDGGEIVGTAAIRPGVDCAAKLDRLYVLPSSQGRGIGTALLGAALAAVPSAECVELEVEPANTEALTFYRRYGFADVGQVSDCGAQGDRIPALRLRLQMRQC